jgi:membrane fusion protein (multidrug efflux system)
VIPEEALTPEAEKQYVYVVADGKAQRREVRIGGRRPGAVEVLAGLSAGDQVVVEGTQKVRDGAPVRGTQRVVDTPAPEEGEPASHEASASPAASVRQ